MEIKFLRGILGKTRKDKIINWVIRDELKVDEIKKKKDLFVIVNSSDWKELKEEEEKQNYQRMEKATQCWATCIVFFV